MRHLRLPFYYFFNATLIVGTMYAAGGTKLRYMVAGAITAIVSWKVLKKYA